MQHIRLAVWVGVLALVATACGGGTAPETTVAEAPVTTAAPATTAVPDTAGVSDTTVAEMPTEELQHVTFTLNFLAGGPQAGFSYGRELGYFEDVGIDLEIIEGQGSATTAQLVATGNTDFGFSDGPSVMAVRAQEGPVTIVAPILQTNGFAVISLRDTGITEPADLVGKRVAIQPGTAQTALLDAILESNDISEDELELVNIDPAALVGALLQNDVDAILAGADSQSISIQEQGFEINEQMFRDIGVPTVGLSIAVNDALIDSDPDLISRFVEASLRGWDAARENPQAAAESMEGLFQGVDAAQILKQLEVDLDLLCAPGAEVLGLLPDENWARTHELLVTYQDLPAEPGIEDYYTNEFLPEDPPGC